MQGRTNKEEWFLDIAERCARQGTCQRRNYGAVVVDSEGYVISTGYTGSPRCQPHCSEYGPCWRERNSIPSGSNYNKCRSVHAEMNALLQAGRQSNGSTMYIAGVDAKTGMIVEVDTCFLCSKMIVNSGIVKIILRQPDGKYIERNPEESFRRIEEKELGKL